MSETSQQPAEPEPFVSVVIATRNRPEDLTYCLPSILAQNYPTFEILVVDQSDTNESELAAFALPGASERLRYIHTSAIGKSRALNTLMEEARGAILAFTDDDTMTPPDWIANIVQTFRENPQAGILFGQVHLCEETAKDPAIIAVPCLYFDEKRYLKRGEIFGMGANMAMRQEVARRGVRFDTLLGPGMPIPAAEEGDFIYRIQRAGVQILLEPKVTLVHRAGRTREQWERIQYGYGVGDAAFAMKHLRCGDLSSLKKIWNGLGYIGMRIVLRTLQRVQHAERFYIRGFWNGIWSSLHLAIDRETRLYRQKSESGSGGGGGSDARETLESPARTSESSANVRKAARP